MNNNTKKQIQYFLKYGITDYTIDGDCITINRCLYLNNLTRVPKDFLKNTTIDGSLYLNNLTTVDKDFLKHTTIGGYLDLRSLTTVDVDFLKNTTIGGGLNLGSLTTVDADFLKNTTIGGNLYLWSLTTVDVDFLKHTTIDGNLYFEGLTSAEADMLRANVKPLQEGYNDERGYCYFDGILRKVTKFTKKKDYEIYTTPFDVVVKKGDFTAHGKGFKEAVKDLEYKIVVERVKKEPITMEDLITVEKYRIITGACYRGMREWLNKHNIAYKVSVGDEIELVEHLKVSDVYTIMENDNVYGFDKFKALIK